MFEQSRPADAPVLRPFAFHGSGGEYFRIWIVNVALTIVTLGIFSAWAKVRSVRYFYGNTVLDGHSFEYHAVPWRILVGRGIAIVVFAAYSVVVKMGPLYAVAAVVLLFSALPWFVVSSLRFNARNTSYRNLRFNFVGTYGGAFNVYVLWTIAGSISLFGLMPLAARAQRYFHVNNHRFGGKAFETQFSGWSIYKVYLFAFAVMIAAVVAAFALVGAKVVDPSQSRGAVLLIGLVPLILIIVMGAYMRAALYLLVVSNTTLDGHHKFETHIDPWEMTWIIVSNIALTLVTLGIFYPWARVRLTNYILDSTMLFAATSLDTFVSDTQGTQSAIGEEMASFFDIDIGL